jgi:hypothetical protein
LKHIYEHQFPNGVRATATITDNPPGFSVQWHQKPSRELLSEYFGWRETILADFTERTGKKVLVVDLATA